MNDQTRMENENKNKNENENRNFEYPSRRYMVDYKHDSRNNWKSHFLSLAFADSAEYTSGNWILNVSNYTLLTDSKNWMLNIEYTVYTLWIVLSNAFVCCFD